MNEVAAPLAMDKVMDEVAAPLAMDKVVAPVADIFRGVGPVEAVTMQRSRGRVSFRAHG